MAGWACKAPDRLERVLAGRGSRHTHRIVVSSVHIASMPTHPLDPTPPGWQVELVVREAAGDRRLGVHQAVNVGSDALPEAVRVSRRGQARMAPLQACHLPGHGTSCCPPANTTPSMQAS